MENQIAHSGADMDSIRLSIETIVTVAVAMFVPTVAAAWALLHALVFRPLNKVTEELAKMSEGLHEVSAKQLEAHLRLEAELRFERLRVDKLENDFETLRARSPGNQGD